MFKAKIVLAVTASIMLTGCAELLEKTAGLSEDTPANAPKGYHTFNNAQRDLSNGNLSLATFNFCNAADLGHPQAHKECSKYTIIQEALLIHDQAKELSKNFLASRARTHICKVEKYGDPAKSLCSKIKTADDNSVIQSVMTSAATMLKAMEDTRINNAMKSGSTSSGLKVEDF